MSRIVAIQATISGYADAPATLFAGYDGNSGVLAIDRQVAYRADRFRDCLVITNDHRLTHDSLFSEREELSEGITAFFSLLGARSADGKSSRLLIGEKAARANPDAAIERDGIDPNGMKYRVNAAATNAQVAALAICLYASRADAIDDAVNMASAFANLASGGILTI